MAGDILSLTTILSISLYLQLVIWQERLVSNLHILFISFICIITYNKCLCLDALEPELEELTDNVLNLNINKAMTDQSNSQILSI